MPCKLLCYVVATFAATNALLSSTSSVSHRRGVAVARFAGKQQGIVVPESELPRVIDVLAKTRETITPTGDELVAIAKRVEVSEVLSLEATMTVARSKRGSDAEIYGNLTASVRQACVSTGAPVFNDISVPFSVPVKIKAEGDDFDDGDDDDDEVVVTTDGKVDVGELVLQYLCIEIDPYPRAGAASTGPVASYGDREDTQPESFLEIDLGGPR